MNDELLKLLKGLERYGEMTRLCLYSDGSGYIVPGRSYFGEPTFDTLDELENLLVPPGPAQPGGGKDE